MITRLIVASSLIVAVTATSVALRMLSRKRSTARRLSLLGAQLPEDLSSATRYLLFTSKYCIPCTALKETLSESGAQWKELRVESDRRWFEALGIRSTPVLLELTENGRVRRVWDSTQTESALAHLKALSHGDPEHLPNPDAGQAHARLATHISVGDES